jgi:hypothetical protein
VEKNPIITMEKSALLGYSGKIRNGGHSLAVEICTVLTKRMAEEVSAPWVFDRESFPRRFGKVELDTEFRSVRVKFTIKGLEQYELAFEPDMLTKFVCLRKGDGKKKAKILALKFKTHYRGNIHDLIDTFERLGGGEGTLTIEQLQTTLPFTEPRKQPERKKHAIVQ